MVSAGRIAVVLPWRETFALKRSGAVALCARDFQRYSRFAADIDVFGAGACEYADVPYRRLEGWSRWWRRDRDAYASAVASATQGHALVEVQNRPYMMPLLRKATGAKLALHLHNDPQEMDGSRRRDERARLLEICDAVYCVSDYIRLRMLEGLADPQGKTVTVLNGAPLPERPRAKTQIVAFTGRVTPIKGAAELVRAFAAAGLEGWRLVIVGSDPKGLLQRLGPELNGRLELRGQISHDDAMALLASAEIAAVPSLWDDPCPRAAIEALAHGCALLTSRRGGLPEIAGEAALYVDPADIAGFAAALRRLGEDEALRRGLQKEARARAAEALDIRVATARLDAMRARLIGIG